MQNKPTSLLIIANAHEALIFEKSGPKNNFDLKLVSELEAELDSNHEKPTRTFNSTGKIRHGVEPRTDRRKVERHKFAEEISKTSFDLETAKPYDHLILMGSHKMLQEIEDCLRPQLKAKISHKLAKDPLEFNSNELKEYVAKNCA